MRNLPLCALFILVIGTGCGGKSDDDDTTPPDAGQPPLTGLGQFCGVNGEPCPSQTPACLTFGSSFNGFCTKSCLESGTLTTDADARPQTYNPELSTGDSVCTPLYSGSIGTSACAVLYDVTPAPPWQPNTTYQVKAACAIKCSADKKCPGNLTCNAGSGNCIAP